MSETPPSSTATTSSSSSSVNTTTTTGTGTSTASSSSSQPEAPPFHPVTKHAETADEDYHHDPQLDRSLAVAIAQLYTPSKKQRIICTHSLVSRVRGTVTDTRCQHCRKAHWFGWVYQCEACGYKVCHNCRPKFLERSWDSIWGLLGVVH